MPEAQRISPKAARTIIPQTRILNLRENEMTPGTATSAGRHVFVELNSSIAGRRQGHAGWRWRRNFYIGRCYGAIRFAVDALHADVVHQMMQRSLNLLQLCLNAALADLAELPPAPAWKLRLHVMEQPVHVVQAPSNLSPVALVLLNMNVFSSVQDLVRCPICLGKSGVVLVVVVQVQAKLVRKPLQPAGQVIHMGERAEFDLDGLGRNVATLRVQISRNVVMNVVVKIVRAMVVVIEVRHQEIPTRVMPIGMVPVEMRIMVMDVMMVDIVVAVIVVMVIPEVNAKSATAKMNTNATMPVVVIAVPIMVIIVMVMSGADKSCRPDCRQDNRHDS
jgi:hypothetical protein